MAGKTNSPFKQTFEKVDKATGGIAGQMKDSVGEMVKDIAKAPMDALKVMLGDMGDTGIEQTSSGGADPQQMQNAKQGQNMTPAMMQKMQESQQKDQEKMQQLRKVIKKYEDYYERLKQEKEQQKQMEDYEEEQKKQVEFQQEEQKKENVVAKLLKGVRGPGKGEVGKKTH